MESNSVSLAIFLIFIAKLQNTKCNDNIFVSSKENIYYIENEQKFTWYDALAKCGSMNMSLLTIDTAGKSQEVRDLLSNTFGKRVPLWIGGCVNNVNPIQFVWISTGKKFLYTNWAKAQPDFAGNNEYCAQTGWTDSMEWNDHVCSNQFGFMCEYSRLYNCEKQLERKVQDETRKRQQVELKQMVGEILQAHKNIDEVKRFVT